MASSSDRDGDEDIPLELIVFSCGACQAIIPEVYARKESNQGFHSDSGGENGVVTKLWIAECSHIMCAKHLPGGAVPFHPQGEHPRAPCVQCQERGDNSLKDLYGIRGLHENEMDTAVPSEWLQCPAIKLDGSVPGMEAVRFQYMNVARYAQRVTKHWKRAERKRRAMETAYSEEHKQHAHVQQEVLNLKARNETLEAADAKLQKWEARKPVINHYLQVVHDMSSDIANMRSQLLQLGYDVPKRSYAFNPKSAARSLDTAAGHKLSDHSQPGMSFSSSSTAVAPEHDLSSASRKRKLAQYEPEQPQRIAEHQARPRGGSRELLPPPLPKPKSKLSQARPSAAAPVVQRQTMPMQLDQEYDERRHERHDVRPKHRELPNEAPRSRLNAQALPFRPSPDTDPHRQDPRFSRQSHSYESAREQSRAHDVREETGHQRAYEAAEELPMRQADRPYATKPSIPFYNRPDTQDMHYDAGYDPGHGISRTTPHAPLQALSALQIDQQLSREIDTRDGQHATERRAQPPVGPAPSPLFTRGAVGRTIESRLGQSQYSRQPRDTTDYDMAPPSRSQSTQVPAYNQRPTMRSSAFVDTLRGATNPKSLYDTSSYRPTLNTGYSGNRVIPQTPLQSQGLFRRPDGPPPSASFTNSRLQQPTAHRSRVSLPPSQHSAMPPAASQERVLSQIRGVRGASSMGVRPNQHNHGPLYEPRAPFSSAGGRRSVRR
ncbi:hypothetical protein LTS10_007761 [Elasticomyces elasticus]|nr:hypothetical protein LTS10_007761 [Elasticomyces elasticus]